LPHSATVEAVTDCEFAVVDEKRFDFLVTETPGFAIEIMRVLAHRLRNTHIPGTPSAATLSTG
jgi:CRP-like cAMP-binding protein